MTSSLYSRFEPNLPLPWCAYEWDAKRYWWRDDAGTWIPMTMQQVERRLRGLGVRSKPEDGAGISQVEARLTQIEDNFRVDYAGPLAGFKRGPYRVNGHLVLVTEDPRIIKASKGEFPLIAEALGDLLLDREEPEHRQVLRYKLLLQRAYRALLAMDPTVMTHLLVLLGAHSVGKSWSQYTLATPVFGGRQSNPAKYLTGSTTFNGEMVGAEHLLSEDLFLTNNVVKRVAIGGVLKMIVSSVMKNFHPKHGAIFDMPAIQRISLSLNSDINSIATMPPWEQHLYARILALKCGPIRRLTIARNDAEIRDYTSQVQDELPAFCWHLLNDLECPDDLYDPRFGFKSWQHPDVIEGLRQISPEEAMLEMVDRALWPTKGDQQAWSGSASDLRHALLKSDYAVEATQQLRGSAVVGVYLNRLAMDNARISNKRTKAERIWTIESPYAARESDAARKGDEPIAKESDSLRESDAATIDDVSPGEATKSAIDGDSDGNNLDDALARLPLASDDDEGPCYRARRADARSASASASAGGETGKATP